MNTIPSDVFRYICSFLENRESYNVSLLSKYHNKCMKQYITHPYYNITIDYENKIYKLNIKSYRHHYIVENTNIEMNDMDVYHIKSSNLVKCLSIHCNININNILTKCYNLINLTIYNEYNNTITITYLPNTLKKLSLFGNYNINKSIMNCNKLEYFCCKFNRTILKNLPKSIKYLYLDVDQSISILLKDVTNLELLECSHDMVRKILYLPNTLKTLNVRNDIISNYELLMCTNLQELILSVPYYCSNYSIYHTFTNTFKYIPSTLTKLTISYDQVYLIRLCNNLIELNYGGLIPLKYLPNTLQVFKFNYDHNIDNLMKQCNNLQELYVGANFSKQINYLPISLKKLELQNNQNIHTIFHMTPNLREFICRSHIQYKINYLPKTLHTFFLSDGKGELKYINTTEYNKIQFSVIKRKFNYHFIIIIIILIFILYIKN